MRERNDARKYLERVEMLDSIVNNKIIEQKMWHDLALGITANMGGERVQSSGSKSKMENALNKVIDMEAEIDRAIDKLIDCKREVIQTLEKLESPLEYNLLHMRYIQYKDLQEIADKYGKEYGWATTNHGRALTSLQEILDRE